jgi:antitoxin CcdA
MLLWYAHISMRINSTMPTIPVTAPESAHPPRQHLKRATNLSLSADVLDAAKQMKINVSQVCDSHLREVVRKEQERRWREEHSDFIHIYNATIKAEGLPLDEWRTF